MFRIRRVYDSTTPVNRAAIAQVQEILHTQFSGLTKRDIARVPKQLRNPFRYGFRSILFVAEDAKHRILGFALLFHEPLLHFCFLDTLSTATQKTGGGIGGALYQRVRQEALSLETMGLFFECLPDDPRLSPDPAIRKRNATRLRFYERYGARPILGTAYETPVRAGQTDPPYLVFDDLGLGRPLAKDKAQTMVRAILERKYGHLCPPEYTERVVASFCHDPVRIRPPRYRQGSPVPIPRATPLDQRIVLTVNDRHAIHHIQERGYVEAPVRIDSILRELEKTDLFLRLPSRRFSEGRLLSVHDADYVHYFKRVCENLDPDESIYPYVFPIRNTARRPKDLPLRAGYYCIDTFTPLNRNAFLAAKRAVDAALTLAGELLRGTRLAYALVRPPGHHAERRAFGGFCYFNTTALAAQHLSAIGPTAILDIDYHHGNGQQEIFYGRADVLTVSLHGHPHFAYPYFSGFEDERGNATGTGFNLNIPLPEHCSPERYQQAFSIALRRILRFSPQFLIVALGLDTAKGDPTGSWDLQANDFERHGRLIGALQLPTLVIQEGGYDTQVLGVNARAFLTGLWQGTYGR